MPEPCTDSGPCAEELARLRRRLDRERNARLEAETVAEKGLRDLYQREQQLQLLEQIATAANQPISVRDVLQFALTQIGRFTGWPVGHAYLCEEAEGDTHLRSLAIWHAADPKRIEAFRKATEAADFLPGLGLPGRVQQTGEPAWLVDVACDDNFPRNRTAQSCGLKAACGFPVLVGREVVAVLEFYAETVLEPDETLLHLMAQIGTQLGRVIERKRAEDRLVHDASHDPLTGLPNRALFRDRLEQAFAHARRGGTSFAVLFIDLDRFKVVNDSLGHQAGDSLIVEVARRLQQSLRREDLVSRPASRGPESGGMESGSTLARLGGDEFTVLLTDIRDPSDAIRVGERLQEALRLPFALDGHEVYATASVGIAVSVSDYGSAEELLRDADLAMYRAKALGKARCELYDRTMHEAAMQRLTLETDLRRALQNNEFVVHYQPIVALDSREIAGFEALVRWEKPGCGLVPPGEFIQVAEDTGLIIFIGLWVLREACLTTKRWHREFPREKPLTISINVSARQFAQPELVAQIDQILRETGIDPRTVRLEITESVTMGDAQRAVGVLSELKALGIQLSIDDFGTGYSSLSYLQRFPLDVLKIDRSFVSEMGQSPESLQIISLIMNLARSLGMDVVAEGTEAEAQVSHLTQLGCDFGQGYLFSKPVGAAAIAKLLRGEPASRRKSAMEAAPSSAAE
jgi:predicted signal transduction protein with EAL and GGDEF domain